MDATTPGYVGASIASSMPPAMCNQMISACIKAHPEKSGGLH